MTPEEIEDLQDRVRLLEKELLIAEKKLEVAYTVIDRLVYSQMDEPDDYLEENMDDLLGRNVMVYLNGKDKPSFRCVCGGNVFSSYKGNLYECNGCGTRYEGIDK